MKPTGNGYRKEPKSMKTEDAPSIELTPECEARLAKFAREQGLSVEEALFFLLSEGVKHPFSGPSPVAQAWNGEQTQDKETM